ncbi:hypothetical protein SEVIR_5G069800v4 [Setaria viridis]|uniref:Uncharacterized protein n=2 Tax=Setaria TaxID=4554 RepID=A0A368R264_SETIT|nr:uncharacterized protein LOC101776907 [Setaria italica]XP_034596085.1 uncharacterized protein LOC117857505 isoform X2 [Setaria viridis]RCV24262.1 hypothetical protein SETIT_5G071000v2 [Setaria italica]TKW12963.1 hypothetical protein SEVIR_5G069800v2 [Setaria viridis]
MGAEMERSILSLCASLSSVLDHADSSSRELADVVSRRPIHLESTTTAFLQKLDRLTEAANEDLAHLDSMTFGAVSFEELLGHCGEALNVYARHADAIESRLASFGYEPPKVEPEVDTEVQDGDIGKLGDPASGCFGVSSSLLRSSKGRFRDDEDPLFGESLKSLGFSDACLATLSSEVTDNGENLKELYKDPESADEGKKIMKEAELIAPQSKRDNQGNSFKEMIRASKEEYEQLPPYMKSLASWEELQEGISKLNSYFGSDEAKGSVSLNQDDVGAIGLGRKGRACLLMLLRLNQLTMEAVDGSTFYTLRKNNS